MASCAEGEPLPDSRDLQNDGANMRNLMTHMPIPPRLTNRAEESKTLHVWHTSILLFVK